MDIRKLTLEERNNPFIMVKHRYGSNEDNEGLLSKIKLNKREKSIDELKSMVFLLKIFNKSDEYINEVVLSTPIKDYKLDYLLDVVFNDVSLNLESYVNNHDIYLKERLSSMSLPIKIEDHLSEAKNCSIVLINIFNKIEDKLKRMNDFSDLRTIFEEKKDILTALSLVLKYNNVESAKSIGLSNELDVLNDVLEHESYKDLNIIIPKVKNEHKHESNKPSQELKNKMKVRRRMAAPKLRLNRF